MHRAPKITAEKKLVLMLSSFHLLLVLVTASKSKNAAVFCALRAAMASFSAPITHFRK